MAEFRPFATFFSVAPPFTLGYNLRIPMDRTLWIILGVAAAVLLLGAFLLLRRRGPAEEEVYHFNCPKCKRRFRFRARQAGHKGECPRCREQFVFPVVRPK